MTDTRESTPFVFAAVIFLVLLPILYIGVGQFLGSVNNTTQTLNTPVSASHVIDGMARMIERDLDTGFCPSSYVWPGHIRYDICGFQEGEQQVWQRLSIQLADHLSREGAASDRDADLSVVLGNVNRPNTWSLFFSSNNTASLLHVAVARLDKYNAKVVANQAGYFPRIDNLSSMIGDLTSLLGGESKHLTEEATNTGFYSMEGRAAYYHTLGTMAASCLVLKAARLDFGDVLKSQSADSIFDQAMAKTCEKLDKSPAIVINARDLSHLLTLAGSAAAAVNDLNSLQIAIAAASHNGH